MISERTYVRSGSVTEAIAYAKENIDDFRYVAGGTDVIVNKFQGNDDCNCLVDITGIDELQKIALTEDYIKIGSLLTLDELINNSEIRKSFPALAEACHAAASPVIRSTATIGGNILCENRCIFYNQSEWWRESVGYCLKCEGDICIATGGTKGCFSKFASDTAPVLIAYNALIEIVDEDGNKIIPLENIYTGDGIHPRNLSKTALIKSVYLPLNEKYYCVFKKLRVREAVDFTSLTTAVSVNEKGNVRVVIGGVDPKPVLVEGYIENDIENYIKASLKQSRAIDNEVYSRKYRREILRLYIKQSFEELKNLSHA